MTALLGSEHWLGWLLVGLTLVLPLGAASVRSDWRLATVVYLVIGCQHGFAFLMTFGKFRPLDLWDASYFDTFSSPSNIKLEWSGVLVTPNGFTVTCLISICIYHIRNLVGKLSLGNGF